KASLLIRYSNYKQKWLLLDNLNDLIILDTKTVVNKVKRLSKQNRTSLKMYLYRLFYFAMVMRGWDKKSAYPMTYNIKCEEDFVIYVIEEYDNFKRELVPEEVLD